MIDSNPKSKGYMCEAKVMAHAAMDGRPMFARDAALTATFIFLVARPVGHYGSGRNAGHLKRSAPKYPTTRPDTVKLVRGVEDAMSGIVYHDDSQISRHVLIREYAADGRPKCEVIVEERE